MDKKLLYFCGILGPFVFLLNDIIGGIVTPNFDYIVQPISDLTQAGSTYLFGSVLLFIAALLSLLFGIGIILHYTLKTNKLIFAGAVFLIINALFNSLTGTIFPQDPREGSVATFAGTMHLTLVGIMVILVFIALILLAVGFNKQHQWKSFRNFSFITLGIMFIFGGIFTPYVISNNIELLGFVERVVAYMFQIWSVVLAYKLIKYYNEIKIKN